MISKLQPPTNPWDTLYSSVYWHVLEELDPIIKSESPSVMNFESISQVLLLRSFVYVSTAYSQATSSRIRAEVLEDFYPSPIDPEAMIRMSETLEDQKLIDITDRLVNN